MGLDKKEPKVSFRAEAQTRIKNIINKSSESWTDDIDLFINDCNINEDYNSNPKQDSVKHNQNSFKSFNQSSNEKLNKSKDKSSKSKQDDDLYNDIFFNQENIYDIKKANCTPKIKTDILNGLDTYNSPKHANIIEDNFRDFSSAMKFNTKTILNRTATPKKDSAFNPYVSEIPDSILNHCQSVKDKRNNNIVAKNQFSNYSHKKSHYTDSLNPFNCDRFDSEIAKEKKARRANNNFNIIDDQIDELLNSSNKKQMRNREFDEIRDNQSYVSSLLNKLPYESKYDGGGYKKQEKENFKTIQGPSYLNGITILQNFEKTSFN